MDDNSLPIGSVIKINNKEGKYVITSKNVYLDNNKYDYACLLYPFGYIGNEDFIYINKEDVYLVYHLGNINYL